MGRYQTLPGLSFPGKGDSLDQYFHEISQIPLIPHEEVVELAKEYHNPKTSSKRQYEIIEELTIPNLKFVISVAKKYQGRGVELGDLISAGNDGLITAAKKYDHERGVKFISYAVWWIRQAILKSLAENSRQARVPLNRPKDIGKVKHKKQELMEAGMSEYAALEAALEETGVDRDIFLSIEGLAKPISLDAPAYEGNSKDSVIDRFHYDGDSTEPTDEGVVKADLSDRVKEALQILDPRDARILGLYFGLNEASSMTLEQIGESFGVTRERIRQIKERALKKLKKGEHGKTLRELYDMLE